MARKVRSTIQRICSRRLVRRKLATSETRWQSAHSVWTEESCFLDKGKQTWSFDRVYELQWRREGTGEGSVHRSHWSESGEFSQSAESYGGITMMGSCNYHSKRYHTFQVLVDWRECFLPWDSYTDLRNRLDPAKVNKLAFCLQVLRDNDLWFCIFIWKNSILK